MLYRHWSGDGWPIYPIAAHINIPKVNHFLECASSRSHKAFISNMLAPKFGGGIPVKEVLQYYDTQTSLWPYMYYSNYNEPQ